MKKRNAHDTHDKKHSIFDDRMLALVKVAEETNKNETTNGENWELVELLISHSNNS